MPLRINIFDRSLCNGTVLFCAIHVLTVHISAFLVHTITTKCAAQHHASSTGGCIFQSGATRGCYADVLIWLSVPRYESETASVLVGASKR